MTSSQSTLPQSSHEGDEGHWVRVQGVRRLVRPDRKRPRVESLMPSSR